MSNNTAPPPFDIQAAPPSYLTDPSKIVVADLISNCIAGGGIAKMTFSRLDMDALARPIPPMVTPVVQVAMSVIAFTHAYAVLENQMKLLLAVGAVSQEILDAARRPFQQPPSA